MNKAALIFLAGCMVVCNGRLSAQEDNALPPPPSPPFVAELPRNSSWKIVFTAKEKAGEKPAAASTAGSPTRSATASPKLKEERRVRYEDTVCIVQSWSDGSTTQQWRYENYLLFMQVGLPDIYIKSKSEGNAAVFPAMSDATFPELGWLAASNYVKVENYRQKSAYLFQGPVVATAFLPNVPEALRPKMKPGDAQAVQKAWIDRESKLPLAFDDGSKVRTYEYSSTPTQPLVLPANFAAALEKYKRDIAGLKRPPLKL